MTQLDRDIVFSECYTKFHFFVYKYCHRYVRDEGVRAELVQDAFVKVYKNLHTFEGERAKISTWIFSIAKNVCLDYLNSSPYKHSAMSIRIENYEVHDKSPSPEGLAITKQRSARLHVAIKDLNKIQREEIGLLLDGYKGFEIAEITKRSHSTVRKSIKRSKDILYGVLQGRV